MKEMEILLIKKKNNPYNEIFLKFEKVYLNMSEEYIVFFPFNAIKNKFSKTN